MYDIEARKQHEVIDYARSLLGITEEPDGSNRGAGVDRIIEGGGGVLGTPWCVWTVQDIWKHVFGERLAAGTGNAYALAEWARRNGLVIPRPYLACPVVYHIGEGHAGIVAGVNGDGSFHAIEGNEANAVRWMIRNPREIPCTFILPRQLHAVKAPAKAPALISEHGKGQMK